ncbi:MAG: hypothetical protein WCY88_08450 [Spongiibacteraceae bacterium]
MNTKLYKQTHTLASELMDAAEAGDDAKFAQLYQLLKTLCYDHENDPQKNHPVQWETLADFTEDSNEALAIYDKALIYAEAINAPDYLASICYAVALLLSEDSDLDSNGENALAAAQQASEHAARIEDSELQREIATLLKKLQK